MWLPTKRTEGLSGIVVVVRLSFLLTDGLRVLNDVGPGFMHRRSWFWDKYWGTDL